MASLATHDPETTPARAPLRPFLKWAGGKTRLLEPLLRAVDAAGPFDNYHEPFLGGGALFLALCGTGRLRAPHYGILSDVNAQLCEAWRGIASDPDGTIDVLKFHAKADSAEHFARMGREFAQLEPGARAARVIYLTKRCFNGLWRVNSHGHFNTPYNAGGRLEVDEEAIQGAAAALTIAVVRTLSFRISLLNVQPGDLVYLDPPYVPISETSSFEGYASGGFGRRDQRELARRVHELHAIGAKVIVSNSWTPLVLGLYADLHITKVEVGRSISAKASSRGKVAEALITTFPLEAA